MNLLLIIFIKAANVLQILNLIYQKLIISAGYHNSSYFLYNHFFKQKDFYYFLYFHSAR